MSYRPLTQSYLKSGHLLSHVPNLITCVGLICNLRPGFDYADYADYSPEAQDVLPAGYSACNPTGNFGPVIVVR